MAEGVESAQQLESLRSLGCDEARGDYFYKPATLAELRARLGARA